MEDLKEECVASVMEHSKYSHLVGRIQGMKELIYFFDKMKEIEDEDTFSSRRETGSQANSY